METMNSFFFFFPRRQLLFFFFTYLFWICLTQIKRKQGFEKQSIPFIIISFYITFSTQIQVTTCLSHQRRRVLHITTGKKGFQEIKYFKLIHDNFSIFLSTLESGKKTGGKNGASNSQTVITLVRFSTLFIFFSPNRF